MPWLCSYKTKHNQSYSFKNFPQWWLAASVCVQQQRYSGCGQPHRKFAGCCAMYKQQGCCRLCANMLSVQNTAIAAAAIAAAALPVGRKLGRGRNEFRMCRNLPSQSAVLCLCLIRHSFHDITTNWRRRRPKIHAKSIRFYVQECNALMVPRELPYIVGISVLLALSLSMMVPVVIYNDNVFQKRPWLLYLLSGIMAFSIEVN